MKFFNSYKVPHWKKGEEIQNYGDFLSEFFLENYFGSRVDKKCSAYHLIGSVISDAYVKKAKKSFQKIGFWSCGARDYYSLSENHKQYPTFFGVRGHLSAQALGLSEGKVIGDSAFLTPYLIESIEPDCSRGVSLIPHFSDQRTDEKLLSLFGGDEVIRTNIPNNYESVIEVTQKIASSKFVLTASLHGAILAYVYGVPFALLNSGKIDCPFKWVDFMSTTGLETKFVLDYKEAMQAQSAHKFTPQKFSARGLVDSCPFEVKLSRDSLPFKSPITL